jgi:pimeloyl-ACP methyl ester carboxylesterase
MKRTADGTAYDLHGPSAAPLVVLIHGLGLNRDVWAQTIPALSAQYRVLAFDILGHGETPPPTPLPTLRLLSQQLAGLLDDLGVQAAVLVGFSLGGMIARRFAQDHPGRTLGLAILHSPHLRDAAAQAAIVARVDEAAGNGPASTVEAALTRWFTDDFRQQNPDIMQKVRDWVMANNPATYPQLYRILADGIDEIVAPHPPIACPTLVMTGDQDYGNGPDMARAIASEIGGAETVILPGLRHMALMEDPESTNTALQAFLGKVVPHG